MWYEFVTIFGCHLWHAIIVLVDVYYEANCDWGGETNDDNPTMQASKS